MRCPRMLSNTAQSQLKEAVPSWFELRWRRDKRRRLWRGTLSERQITTLQESNDVDIAHRIRPARWTAETDMLQAFWNVFVCRKWFRLR